MRFQQVLSVFKPNLQGVSEWLTREELQQAGVLSHKTNGLFRHGVAFGRPEFKWLKEPERGPIKKIRIEKAWIVSQFAGDFNPPHLHRGNISGVGYLKIPSSIKRNKEKDLAGLISFFDGRVSLPRNSPPLVKHRETFKPRVGDLYIFPSFLMHDVHPFRGDGERRCFSFNAFVDA